MTTPKQLASMTAQHNEIIKRVVNGSLDADDVRTALQLIIEKKIPIVASGNQEVWRMPHWYVLPEDQLYRARLLWPGRSFPEPPAEFIPQTPTEVMLLHVPRSIHELWDMVELQGVMDDKKTYLDDWICDLRSTPPKVESTEPVWVVFDAEHGSGISPTELWSSNEVSSGRVELAGLEVLSALVQFPDWYKSWERSGLVPFLSGYQASMNPDKWNFVPYLNYSGYELTLGTARANTCSETWGSPTVRKL